MPSGAAALAALALAACAPPSALGDSFLRGGGLPAVSQEVGPELERALAAEVEEALSLGGERWRAAQGRAVHIKEALRPTFASMPKNEHGKLGHAAVRYVLHRLFVSRHAWFIQGLRPEGENGSVEAGAAGMLHDQVPERVQSLFERRMGTHGLGLEELTVLAATLEHLVHNEVSGHLRAAFRLFGVGGDDQLPRATALQIVEAYMAVYILGGNISAMPAAAVHSSARTIAQVYPTWSHTQDWVRAVYDEGVPQDRKEAVTFGDLVGVVEEVGERYGRWQNTECLDLKGKLGGYGDTVTGRVRLADFYSGAVRDGHWQFTESVAYLRELGALDESDPEDPRVIISNYINSPSNCVASSSYYSVCCINECEALLGSLEEQVGGPEALPGELSARVATLPSGTREGGRRLSEPLLAKLQEVADHHGGRVPLHGRLFAQWLHYAFPRTCPFPHKAGSVSAQTPTEFGDGHAVSSRDMQEHGFTPQAPVDKEDLEWMSQWSSEEELLADYRVHLRAPWEPSSLGAAVLLGAAALALAMFSGAAGFSKPTKVDSLLPSYQKAHFI